MDERDLTAFYVGVAVGVLGCVFWGALLEWLSGL